MAEITARPHASSTTYGFAAGSAPPLLGFSKEAPAAGAREELGGREGFSHPPLQVGEPFDGESVPRRHLLGAVQGALIEGHCVLLWEKGSFWRVRGGNGCQTPDARWQMPMPDARCPM